MLGEAAESKIVIQNFRSLSVFWTKEKFIELYSRYSWPNRAEEKNCINR